MARGLLLGVALLALGAASAAAATWTCADRTDIPTTTVRLVMVRCTASGTYTTGGDSFSDLRSDLCNSENRRPVVGVSSTTTSAVAGQAYVTAFDRVTEKVVLLTATNTPGPQNALIELASGTAIDGATFTALIECK